MKAKKLIRLERRVIATPHRLGARLAEKGSEKGSKKTLKKV